MQKPARAPTGCPDLRKIAQELEPRAAVRISGGKKPQRTGARIRKGPFYSRRVWPLEGVEEIEGVEEMEGMEGMEELAGLRAR